MSLGFYPIPNYLKQALNFFNEFATYSSHWTFDKESLSPGNQNTFLASSRFFYFSKVQSLVLRVQEIWLTMNESNFFEMWWWWTWVLPSKQKARRSTTALCSFFVEIEPKQKCLSSAYRKRKAKQQFDIGKSFCNNFFPQPDTGERKWWWRQHHSHCTSAQRSNSKFQFV